MLLRAEALAAVGGLDEAYFLYYEDADWGVRAARSGWRTRYVNAAVVRHAGWSGTRADPARRRYYNVRNRLGFARRHAPWRGRVWVYLATAALAARQPIRWLWPSRRRDAEAVLWAVADHLRGRYGRSRRFG
jgi:GT2 family glycosyltransferase